MKAIKSFETLFTELSTFAKTINAKKLSSQLMYAYQQRIESLNFAAIISRFDIVFVIVKLVQYLQLFILNYLVVIDRVISSLNETRKLVIKYSSI